MIGSAFRYVGCQYRDATATRHRVLEGLTARRAIRVRRRVCREVRYFLPARFKLTMYKR